MKKFVSFLIVVCIFSLNAFAQDVITLRNGDDIKAVVQEVGESLVKYKKYDYQDGPIYTIKKSDIFMIRYVNGSKDVFNEPTTTALTITQQANNRPLKYAFGIPINTNGPKKSPFLAGFLSFLVPGLGQFYNGDIGSGFVYLGTNVLCNSVWMNATDDTVFAVGLISALTINICSIIDGALVAKKVNIVRGYKIADKTYFKLNPTIIQQKSFSTNKNLAYGMSLSLNF